MARVKCIIIAFSIQVITTLRVGSIAALKLIVCVGLVKGMEIQNLKVSVVSLRRDTSPEIQQEKKRKNGIRSLTVSAYSSIGGMNEYS
jgi:hypothetical protein